VKARSGALETAPSGGWELNLSSQYSQYPTLDVDGVLSGSTLGNWLARAQASLADLRPIIGTPHD
jgi:hypothetical protein